MLGLGIFRRKPRQFEYKPRYFDADKEARDKRRAELHGEVKDDGEEYKPGRIVRFAARRRRDEFKKRANYTKQIIVLGLIALFARLLYMLGY